MLKHYFFLFSMKTLTLHLLSIVDTFDGWLIFERYCGMDLTKDSSFPFFYSMKLLDTCTAIIIPLVQKFCDEIPKDRSESLLTVARLFGKLSYGLSGVDRSYNVMTLSRVFT